MGWNGCVGHDPTGQILTAWIAKEELRALCALAGRESGLRKHFPRRHPPLVVRGPWLRHPRGTATGARRYLKEGVVVAKAIEQLRGGLVVRCADGARPLVLHGEIFLA